MRSVAFLYAGCGIKPIMAARKIGPVTGLPKADHLAGDVFVADEALRNGAISAGWPAPPVAGRSCANLEAVHLLASDHIGERVGSSTVTWSTPFRAVDAAKPDLDATDMSIGLDP